MCFDEPFDGVYLAFSDSSSVGRTTTAIAVIEGVTGSSPVYPIKLTTGVNLAVNGIESP